jgi:RND family efflux transporter MFP subunit
LLESDVPLRVASLDLRIAELRAQRDGAEVRASFDGTVYKTAARSGERVRSGDAVVWFADLERPRVRANVDQVDLGRVRVGQKARITSNAYRDRSWSAEIEELIPNVVKKQSRFVAEVLAPVAAPATGLLPGMSVDVEIVVDAVPDALQIPSEALFRDEEGAFVYRVDDDRVRVTRVLVGRSTVGSVEVLRGLSEGDRVVLGPVTLGDGALVKSEQSKPSVPKQPPVGARDGD